MTGSDCTTAPRESATAGLSLDDVRREFPAWHIWAGVSGMSYASLRCSPPLVVRATDPASLRDEIRRALDDI
jgi:hypothetical protein